MYKLPINRPSGHDVLIVLTHQGDRSEGISYGIMDNIWAAWAVDREFVHILGPSGEVSKVQISVGMILNSFGSPGCALGSPGAL